MAAEEETYLDKLKDAIKTNQVTARARAAGNWFRSVSYTHLTLPTILLV